jgi:hypothetical protein
MRSMRPVGTIVLFGMWLGGLSGCTSVLQNTPVSKTAEGWKVTLGEVKEGPDEYVGDVSTVAAGTGERLIWTFLTVKNEAAQEETFNYDSCVLDGKTQTYQPVVVDRNVEVFTAADRAESFEPGVERTRRVLYSFPKDERPKRMRCGAITLPIAAPR